MGEKNRDDDEEGTSFSLIFYLLISPESTFPPCVTLSSYIIMEKGAAKQKHMREDERFSKKGTCKWRRL